MNSRKHVLFLVAALISLGVLIGCQRSPRYRPDSSSDTGESATGYYGAKAREASATQRVEAVGQPKKKLAILDFLNDTPIKQKNLGEYAADELRRTLYEEQRSILPSDAKPNLATHEFVKGDQVNVAQLVREGRRMGVAVLGIGKIAKIVFRQKGDDVGLFRQKQSLAAVDLEMKLFDVQTGRELLSGSRSAESSKEGIVLIEGNSLESPAYRAELIRSAIRKATSAFVGDISKAIDKLAWQGHIAKIMGPRIYVNAGRASGLVNGDILRVLTPGDDIYDPSSGAYLGHSRGRLKGTLEVVDFIGPDGAATQIHTGGNLREGDVVQLY